MNKDINILHIRLRLTLFILLMICPAAFSVEIITHPSVEISTLTTSQLRRIYSMRQVRWPNNGAIVVFTLSSQAPLHKLFCNEKLRIFPYQLDRIWNKLTFSGLGVSPTVLNNQTELIQAVINTPGSIGYVDSLGGVEYVHVINIEE